MRKLGGSPVKKLEPIPEKPGWYDFATEQGRGEIREDVLGKVDSGGKSMIVPDLSRIRGTRQHRERVRAERLAKA